MATQFSIRPLAPACGAEVFGIDLADPSPASMQTVQKALASHAVLFFHRMGLFAHGIDH